MFFMAHSNAQFSLTKKLYPNVMPHIDTGSYELLEKFN